MIRVSPQPEPTDFHHKVRIPGQRCIEERIGNVAGGELKRTGGPPCKKTADSRDEIKPDDFRPYWREVLPEVTDSYDRICAFSCFYIERITGDPQVDHMIPKSKSWEHVYEWTNYRLACGLMNTRKSTVVALDPFEIEDDWFALELGSFQVCPGRACPKWLQKDWDNLIDGKLKLNEADFCTRRREEAERFWRGETPKERFFERSPFLAREIDRQGFLQSAPYLV